MKKISITISIIIMLIIGIYYTTRLNSPSRKTNNQKILTGQVICLTKQELTIQDDNNIIYTINQDNIITKVGDQITLEYDHELNKNIEKQEIEIINYHVDNPSDNYQDNGLFKDYYPKALNTLQTMSIDEKINQLFLVRVPQKDAKNILAKQQFGGYLFFERDFKNKTKQEVQTMIQTLQQTSKIPLLTAIDEEGGKVSRLSSNKNLVTSPFKSSQELYQEGGFSAIREDTIKKSNLLNELGLNLNLAPVVDVSTNENDYIYPRTLGEDYSLTSQYAKTVIEASHNTQVSYTLKHFPGYGNNRDTHLDLSVDDRDYNRFITEDLKPFQAGINAKAEAVMISHNTVTAMDKNNPSSLSKTIHNLLRNHLQFTGIIITDDLNMGAVSQIENNTLKALLAGNDLIITTDYEKSFNEIKQALLLGQISENLINKNATRIIAWKYYKGLMK